MGQKSNRLAKHVDSMITFRADGNIRYLLAALTSLGGPKESTFTNQSEVIYEALYQFANKLGIKTPLGGEYETLSKRAQLSQHLFIRQLNDETPRHRSKTLRFAELAGQSPP
jgi:hypothetical protein